MRAYRKIVIIVILFIFISTSLNCNLAINQNIDKSSWSYEYIQDMVELNIINLSNDINYKNNVSVIEASSILDKCVKLFNITNSDIEIDFDISAGDYIKRLEIFNFIGSILFSQIEIDDLSINYTEMPFGDIEKTNIYKNVYLLYKNNIICGDNNHNLNLESPITYEELFKILSLSYKYSIIKRNDIEMLWSITVEKYLQDDLWESKNIYDAGHSLMIPLTAAYKLNNIIWISQFEEHFDRFCTAFENNEVDISRLNLLHYLNLCSQYIKYSNETGIESLTSSKLEKIVYENLERIWLEEAWQWGSEPFSNMRERIYWKLTEKNPKYSYLTAIIDEETFCFSIAANLLNCNYVSNNLHNSVIVNEILDTAYKVFTQKSVFIDDGGYLFQPGVWTDHPDYEYCGNESITNDMTKKKIENISEDSSHSSRLSLFLSNLKSVYNTDSEQYVFYSKALKSLAKQVTSKVLVLPTEDFEGYRMTNFMDGWNGIYRWNYVTQGEGNGYQSYELSGTFLLGWWAFLQNDEIDKAYNYMSMDFPLKENVIAIYTGPNTSRSRNKYVAIPNFYENGFAQLICNLAMKINN